jgi:hypothetical protein
MPQLFADVFFDQTLQGLVIFIGSALLLSFLIFPFILLKILIVKNIFLKNNLINQLIKFF